MTDPSRRLAAGARSLQGEAHRTDRGAKSFVVLQCVGRTHVGRNVGPAIDHLLIGDVGSVNLAELKKGVAEQAVRRRAIWIHLDRSTRPPDRTREVVASVHERGHPHERLEVVPRLQLERATKGSFCRRQGGRIGFVARLLQICEPKLRMRFGVLRVRIDAVLERRDRGIEPLRRCGSDRVYGSLRRLKGPSARPIRSQRTQRTEQKHGDAGGQCCGCDQQRFQSLS